jgi:hypothetical protein
MSKLLNQDLAKLIQRLFELTNEQSCTVLAEESPKGYTSLTIKYDYGVDNYSSFVILHHEDNSTGAEADDYEAVLNEVENIVAKARRLRETA